MKEIPSKNLQHWMEYAGIGVVHLAPDNSIDYANSVMERVTGHTMAALDGGNADELLSDFHEILARARSGEQLHGVELTAKRENTYYWFLVNAYSSDDGGVQLLVEDITDSKEVQRRLEFSEKKLTSIVDTIPDVIYRTDDEGIIVFISDAIRRYGYTPDELMGKSIIDIVHPEDRERAMHHVKERRTKDRKTRSFMVRLITANQSPVSVHMEECEIEDKEIFFSVSAEGLYLQGEEGCDFVGTQGIARDMSRSINAEKNLEATRERCSGVLQSLEDGYYETNCDGRFVFVNRALAAMLGESTENIIGKKYQDFIPADNQKHVDHIFQNVGVDGESDHFYQWVMRKSNGRNRRVEGSVVKILDTDGEATGFRGIIRDITERHHMEQELLRARKLEAVGILAGGLAHDYNNALTAIIGNLSLAKMEAADNADLMEILTDAESASLKIRDLTQRLSTFSKGGKPDRRSLHLGNLLADIADYSLDGYKGRWKVQVDDTLSLVEGDEFQLTQVFQHLIQNAVEATGHDGEIIISAENHTVEEEESHHEITLQPGRYVRITVRDNGEGILPEHLETIFDPYFSTRKMASGMGLAISYAVIKRHRGYIDVSSEHGKGAEFYVYMPVMHQA